MSTGEVRSANAGQAEVGAPIQAEWHKNASSHLGTQAEIYQRTLKTVSEAFAHQEQSEVILVRHVNEAHSALARVGMSNLSFLSRPENLTAIGGILIGASFAASDITGVFIGDGPLQKGAAIGWFFSFLAIGLFLYSTGWKQGQLPMPPGHRGRTERAINWVVATLEPAGRWISGKFSRD